MEAPSEAWPFVCHLNDIHRRTRYFDRAWMCINWAYPSPSGYIGTSQLHEIYVRGGSDLPIVEVFRRAYFRKISDDLALARALCDALACVAPDLYDERVSTFADLMAETGDEWEAPPNANSDRKLTVSGFLYCVEWANSILAKRDLELGKLQEGHYLALWNSDKQKLGAQRGGNESAISRRLKRKADPAKIRSDAETLRAGGQEDRYIASIIAGRCGVTADYIRRLLKEEKIRPEHGSVPD